MTLLNDPRPISADSHALEGPEVFEGLPERFGDDALPVQDPEGAVVELRRVIKLGFKGIVIPSNAPRGRRYCDEEYEPMWARAEEAGLPIAFHVACMSHSPDWLKASAGRDPIVQYALFTTL